METLDFYGIKNIDDLITKDSRQEESNSKLEDEENIKILMRKLISGKQMSKDEIMHYLSEEIQDMSNNIPTFRQKAFISNLRDKLEVYYNEINV